jgi:hypothetical protein
MRPVHRVSPERAEVLCTQGKKSDKWRVHIISRACGLHCAAKAGGEMREVHCAAKAGGEMREVAHWLPWCSSVSYWRVGECSSNAVILSMIWNAVLQNLSQKG